MMMMRTTGMTVANIIIKVMLLLEDDEEVEVGDGVNIVPSVFIITTEALTSNTGPPMFIEPLCIPSTA